MFTDLIGDRGYNKTADIPLTVILPAFITSELKADNWFFTIFTIFSHRYGDCFYINVFRDIDVKPHASGTSI